MQRYRVSIDYSLVYDAIEGDDWIMRLSIETDPFEVDAKAIVGYLWNSCGGFFFIGFFICALARLYRVKVARLKHKEHVMRYLTDKFRKSFKKGKIDTFHIKSHVGVKDSEVQENYLVDNMSLISHYNMMSDYDPMQ